MKKLIFLVLALLVAIGFGLLAKKTFSVNNQVGSSTVQICPPECFPEEKTCG
ncbi:MAG: hypothetical protein AAB359_04105 [Elusimicrobiota bacterium]